MMSQKKIAVLNPSGYQRAYFRHGVDQNKIRYDMPEQYVEIGNRCLWNDVIDPHRLDFYIIFLATEGAGKQTLGLNEYAISGNRLGFIGPNVISAWHSESNTQRGYFIAFSEEFYASLNHRRALSQLPFFQLDGESVLDLNEREASFCRSLFQMMEEEHKAHLPSSNDVIRGLLHALLTKALARYGDSAQRTEREVQRGVALVKAFRELYMADMGSIRSGRPILHRKVSDYASMLAITPNHLNDTVRKVTGRSATQLIHDQLAKQASMCLLRSDKSIAEVSFLLGFEDSAYFARFFRGKTGKSPSAFRNQSP